MPPFEIDPDIRRAATPPAAFYRDPAWYALQRERVFARSWQFAPDAGFLTAPGAHAPRRLLAGCLDEPVVFVRDGARTRCLSNVCTHRGNLVAARDGVATSLRCGYHGRRFALDGRMLAMPEFDGVEGFPSPADDLAPVPLEAWGPFHFAALAPAFPFDALVAPLRERLAFLPLERFAHDASSARDYEVRAHWALYCDNYLEGFHIPFVHPALNDAVAYDSYRAETFAYASLQVAHARRDDAPVFEPPAGHPDHGARVAAYYAFLFPNTMFNFYPWGLSTNVVVPLAPDRTRVAYRSYVWRDELRERGAGTGLHQTELEDEAVVEAVQAGVSSRLYRRGRYSPRREVAVHHFHRLLARLLGDGDGDERA